MQKPNLFFTVLLIFVAVFFSYSNSFKNKFVYDDRSLIVENKYIHNWNYLPAFFRTGMWSFKESPERPVYYRPLPAVTFLVDYTIWGLNPSGYHFVNTLFHAVNGMLVFLILNSLTGNFHLAAASGLLFAVHPAQTEAVTFISSRCEVLFLFFLLLTILLFIKDKILFSTICFSLALLSKETALITPALLFLVTYYFLPDKLAGNLKKFVPSLIVIAVYFLFRATVLPPVKQSGDILTSLNRFAYSMTYGVLIYLRILFFPVNLFVEYDLRHRIYIFEPVTILSILLSTSLFIIAFLTGKNLKVISFSIFWFYAGLLPASHILYRMPYLVAERMLYLPSIGFCIFIGWVMSKMFEKNKGLSVTTFIIILLIFSMRTINRNFDWGDELLLWGGVLKQFPELPKAHMNLGVAYDNVGNYEKAIEHYKKALDMEYFPEPIRLNLASIYKKMNRIDLSLNEY
ncbi:MAG: tetratricopeptide repeat protein, partial [Elusimicrobiota bacterium]